jgi:ubiquinone/menaquinone biosynthesis C-methylase UbiE
VLNKEKHESWWDRKAAKNFLDHRKRPEVFKRIAELLKENGDDTIDVGCAHCLAYPHIIEADLVYTGLDFTLKFLEHAKTLYPGIELKHASALEIPYDNCEFETSFCQSLLEHIRPEDVHKAINEQMRIAKNYTIFAFFRPPWNKDRNVVTDRDYVTVRYSSKFITDIIEAHPRFDSLEIERFKRWALYKVHLIPCEFVQ